MRFRKQPTPPTPPTPPASAAGTLRPLLHGDVPMAGWPPPGAAAETEPWATFVRARTAYAAGRTDEAVRDWLAIARGQGAESRCVLQAWTFLRQAGVGPAPEEAALVLGVVCEVGTGGGHDVLAAYRDGSARYLNHAGGAAVTDEAWPETRDLVRAAAPLGAVVGLWDRPELPPLPAGHSRLLLLTPGGFRFGQGPSQLLFGDDTAGPVLRAAVRLLQRFADAAR